MKKQTRCDKCGSYKEEGKLLCLGCFIQERFEREKGSD